MPVSH